MIEALIPLGLPQTGSFLSGEEAQGLLTLVEVVWQSEAATDEQKEHTTFQRKETLTKLQALLQQLCDQNRELAVEIARLEAENQALPYANLLEKERLTNIVAPTSRSVADLTMRLQPINVRLEPLEKKLNNHYHMVMYCVNGGHRHTSSGASFPASAQAKLQPHGPFPLSTSLKIILLSQATENYMHEHFNVGKKKKEIGKVNPMSPRPSSVISQTLQLAIPTVSSQSVEMHSYGSFIKSHHARYTKSNPRTDAIHC